MKTIIVVLSFITLNASAQKIESNTYDRFEDQYRVASKLPINSKILKPDYFIISVVKTFTPKINLTSYTVLITFKPRTTISTDKDTDIKLEMEDGEIVSYKNVGAYDITSGGGLAVVAFHPYTDQKVFSSRVKSLRVSASGENIDLMVPEKKGVELTKTFNLVKETEYIK